MYYNFGVTKVSILVLGLHYIEFLNKFLFFFFLHFNEIYLGLLICAFYVQINIKLRFIIF